MPYLPAVCVCPPIERSTRLFERLVRPLSAWWRLKTLLAKWREDETLRPEQDRPEPRGASAQCTRKRSERERRAELRVALFDVDGTLLKGSSSYQATWFLFDRNMVGPQHVFLALWYGALHGLGLVSYEKLYAIGLKIFHGMTVEEVVELSRRCLEERVATRLFVGALHEIMEQRRLGREVVLVSAGPRYLIQVIAEEVNADSVITAGPLVQTGRITGVLDGQVCSGLGKVQRVSDFLRLRGVPLESCLYYGDSINDLPLLEVVGEPVAVNPDPRLWRVAATRGWRILRFFETSGANRSVVAKVARGTSQKTDGDGPGTPE